MKKSRWTESAARSTKAIAISRSVRRSSSSPGIAYLSTGYRSLITDRDRPSIFDRRASSAIYPPKSSKRIFSDSTPRSVSILMMASFIIGGPQR